MVASKSSKRQQAIKHGYRSGLEDDISEDLKQRGVAFGYETMKIKWVLHRNKSYTPDFILPNGVIVESKGRFTTDDRSRSNTLSLTYGLCSAIVGLRSVKVQRRHWACGQTRMASCTQTKGYPKNG